MFKVMDDPDEMVSPMLDAVASLKSVAAAPRADEEVLQTRIVAMHEVRRDLEDWKGPIKKELQAMLEEKKALRSISQAEVKALVQSGEACGLWEI